MARQYDRWTLLRSLLSLTVLVGWGVACTRSAQRRQSTERVSGEGADLIVTIDDVGIPRREFDEFVGHRETNVLTNSERQRLTDSFLQYELLAKEALDRHLDQEASVIRAKKQAMVHVLMEREPSLKVNEDEIAQARIDDYRVQHQGDSAPEERIRVSQIVTRTKEKAATAFFAAKTPSPRDDRGFRDVVLKFSEDPTTRDRSGDIGAIDRVTRLIPTAAVSAAFALKTVGDLSEPVATDKGYYILRLTERQPPALRPQSTEEIRQRIRSELGAKRVEDWIRELKQRHKIDRASLK